MTSNVVHIDKPTFSSAPSPAKDIKGNFEACDTAWIVGWAYDNASSERLHIEILSGGNLVANGVADLFRSDLLEAGIGDGKHCFKIMSPEVLFDGNEHVIEAREVSTGFVLPGSPKIFCAETALPCKIVLEGNALVGWATLPEGVDASLLLIIMEGTTVIGQGNGTPDEGITSRVHFRILLPNSVFDGRPHSFSVRSQNSALLLGQLALITPHMLTPESALQQYAREGLKPSLSTVAGFRYESFVNSIARFADESVSSGTFNAAGSQDKKDRTSGDSVKSLTGEQLAQIVRAHTRLVRGFSESDKIFEPLTFPKVENPRVSIVIPVHNKFYVTYHCLSSLLLSVNRVSFEVIIVDDGSNDESTTIPELISGVQYIRNGEAQGFIGSCNLGGGLAHGEYIVMLNNDTEVTSGWLDELLWPFEHFDKVGLTGAKLLYANGTLQEAGGIVWNTGDPWNYGRNENPHDPRYNYARQVDYLSGACIMLPTKLWDEIGGFNATYKPAYFEDTDLAFRVREKGYKTVYTPFSQVIHYEGMSNGTNKASGIKRFQEINRPKFKNFWVGSCRHNGKVGDNIDINKDRNVEFRALVLDVDVPMPDQHAGGYAALQEIRMLQTLGFKCTFAPNNMTWMGHYTEELQRMGVECLYAPFASSINEIITTRGSEFDLVYITRYYVAQQYIDLIREHAPRAKIVLMNADLHFLRELRAAIEEKNQKMIVRAKKTRSAELAVMRKVDLVLSYTDVEMAVILSHNLDTTRVARCPWVTEVTNDVPGFDARADIAFLGGYNHPPNVEAVEWFAEKVMPMLRIALPGIKFHVYGSHVPTSLLTLAEKHKDMVIEGWVPSVGQVYNTCRIFVAPLQSGAGIKGKVIGSLAHGTPCVLSPIAAEGIPVGDGVEACVAHKPEEWVSAITKLYEDSNVWSGMSRQALSFAQNQYGFAKGVVQMREALREADIFTSLENNALAAH